VRSMVLTTGLSSWMVKSGVELSGERRE
jgi:hypothetical protein